jgi:hypothetical protein
MRSAFDDHVLFPRLARLFHRKAALFPFFGAWVLSMHVFSHS